MVKRTALVPGALGVTGRAIIEHLDNNPNWNIIGLSRRPPNYNSKAKFLSVDLLNRSECNSIAEHLAETTHVFFCAYAPQNSVEAEIKPNVSMLANLMDVLEPVSNGLEHIQLMHGAKWYGSYLGPYKTPAKEDDPRPLVQNFYHAQQDWIKKRQKEKAWSWSALRPHGIWGFSIGGRMNLMTGIVLYAVISKHLGLQLRWPGKQGFYDCLYNIIDTDLLADGMQWTATNPNVVNNAYNISNGDFFRWNQVWPRIASFFDMEVGPVQTLPLKEVMVDKEETWSEIIKIYGLQNHALAELTNWDYLDMALGNSYDQMSSITKIRQAGWNNSLDTENTIVNQIQKLRDIKIIP